MKESFYKLNEYKIIESYGGELRWESHSGIGRLQQGRCFKKGMILFIGSSENDRIGFLKGEFLDHLKQFPVWLKTKYYCRGLEVYHCKTGKKVTKAEMRLWMINRSIDEGGRIFKGEPGKSWDDISTRRATGDVSFMLQRYEIIKKANGQIIWKTYAGPNTAIVGNCIILEDILFIGSRQDEQSTFDRRQFLANLQQLPKWDQSRYYCPKLSLHDCKTGSGLQEDRKKWPVKGRTTKTHTSEKGHRNMNGFNAKIVDLSQIRAAKDFTRWVWKFMTYVAAQILLVISLFFNCLTRIWKEFKRKWHHKKRKRSYTGHHDD